MKYLIKMFIYQFKHNTAYKYIYILYDLEQFWNISAAPLHSLRLINENRLINNSVYAET